MSVYWVGDLQGCDEPLGQLLDQVAFSTSRDRLYVLGDLVNRGPSSLAVLRRLSKMGSSVECVLGNHDLHLLALAAGARQPSRTDTLQDVLEASDRHTLLDWLQNQAIALFKEDVLMVHAGVLPQWSLSTTLELAHEIESVLRGPDAAEFFMNMYGNEPAQWHPSLKGMDRLRCALNAFTRLRFCSATGHMDFKVKENSAKAPEGYAMVRSSPSPNHWHKNRIWTLVHPRRRESKRHLGHGHGLCLGRMSHGHSTRSD